MVNEQCEIWLRMIKAKSEEELNILITENNPYINKGIDQIMSMNADEKFREYMRERDKWKRDYLSSMSYAEKEGRAKGRAEAMEEFAEILRKNGHDEKSIEKMLASMKK